MTSSESHGLDPDQRETAQLLRAIVDWSDDAIISRLVDGTITSWNPAAERMFGYSASEVIGKPLPNSTVPLDRVEERLEDTRRLAAGETVRHPHTQRVRRDGTVLEISTTLAPLRDAEGAVVGASVIVREIAERLAVERQQRMLDARIRQVERLESLGQLAGGIAHDFNNLLAVIGNYAGFVESELDDPAAIRADIEQIQIATTRAVTLTRQLLAFARRETLQPRVFSLNDVIIATDEMLRETIGPHITLVTTLAPDLARVDCDPTQVQHVLVNLAANARDAMPSGGQLHIETTNVEIEGRIAAEYSELVPGRYVELCVTDDGTGMTPEVLEHAFEPFFTTKARGHGAGLGLSMIFGSVTQAGGAVRMHSEVGAGSSCRVLLPATERIPTVPFDVMPTEPPGGETILVVDDEPAVREAVRRHLVNHGYTILDCPTGEAAIALAEEYDEAIHLLVSDVLMPGMTGQEVAERIVAIRPGLPVLFMSGYAQPELGGAVAENLQLLEKPFTERSLLDAVQIAIERDARER